MAAKHELRVSRTFDAPRSLVWEAWTDPARLRHWMGPRGFTASHPEYDLRPGGQWRVCLRRDGSGQGCAESAGDVLWQSGRFIEVVEPERLVFTFGWDGRNDIPRHDTVVTVTFEEKGGKTEMNFHQAYFETVESRDGHAGGWNSSFDRLGQFITT